MVVNGHGISAAVRASIKEWMTDKVIDLIYKEAQTTNKLGNISKQTFSWKLRSDEEWKRISRSRDNKVGVWSRKYYSKLFGKGHVGLTVLTNKATPGKQEDMYIEYVTITIAGKVIGGGQVKIPSVKLSQWGREASIKNFESNSLFTEFTTQQLAQINAELEFGEEAMFTFLEERIV
jgi:hypothetical protein